jgi:FkbM family methyltransferase
MRRISEKVRRVARIQARVARNAVAMRVPELPRRTAHGPFVFHYPSRSIVGRAVAEGIVWDAHLLDIVRVLPESAVVCEVGSNIGASMLTMAGARPDLRFVCFEPSERFHAYLRSNVNENGLSDRVTIEQALVGPAGSEWALTSSTSSGSVVQGRYDGHIPLQSQTVTALSLDDYFAERDTAPALVKIDTDGFELKVLRSAAALLKDRHPALFVEYTPSLLERVGDQGDELRAFLLDSGYSTADLYRGDGLLLEREHDLRFPIETPDYLDLILRGTQT